MINKNLCPNSQEVKRSTLTVTGRRKHHLHGSQSAHFSSSSQNILGYASLCAYVLEGEDCTIGNFRSENYSISMVK